MAKAKDLSSETLSKALGQAGQLPALLSEKEAATYLHIAYRTLWGWRKQGRISHIRFGTSVRYRIKDLDDFIQSHRFQA